MSLSWHLAIESSGLGGSVALFEYDGNFHGQLHSQLILPNSMGSVRTLAPAIEQLLREAQLLVKQLGSLSVTNGPGSFTGLRVGLATAKMFAWTQRIPVVPVDTLEAIANRFAQASSARRRRWTGHLQLGRSHQCLSTSSLHQQLAHRAFGHGVHAAFLSGRRKSVVGQSVGR